MKARILFMLRLLLIILLSLFSFSNAENANAENVYITKKFSTKEIVRLQTSDIKTPNHELFEYHIYSMFQSVPYLEILPIDDEQIKGAKIETFVPNFQEMEEKGQNYMIYYTMENNGSETLISYIVFDGLYQNTLFSGSYKTKENIEKID